MWIIAEGAGADVEDGPTDVVAGDFPGSSLSPTLLTESAAAGSVLETISELERLGEGVDTVVFKADAGSSLMVTS
jgi:hypothetical protein